MKPYLSITLLLAATACTSPSHLPPVPPGVQQVAHGARQVAINVRDNAIKVYKNAKTYAMLPPYQEPPGRKPVKERYCYQVMQDIMCYRSPKLGADGRLVGYQGGEQAEQVAPDLVSDSTHADTSVQAVEVMQGQQATTQIPQVTQATQQAAQGRPAMIIGDARDRAFENKSPGSQVKPIFIPAPPAVAGDSSPTPPPPPATPSEVQ